MSMTDDEYTGAIDTRDDNSGAAPVMPAPTDNSGAPPVNAVWA